MIGRLPDCYCKFDLSEQVHYLLWLAFLSSSHTLSLFQFLFFTGAKFTGHSKNRMDSYLTQKFVKASVDRGDRSEQPGVQTPRQCSPLAK
jgi:hypothetical protein